MATNSIKQIMDDAVVVSREELRRRVQAGEKLYPNMDNTLAFRTCEKEIEEPIRGTTTGKIPEWLNGALLRNGGGASKIGDTSYQHLFDGPALIHRFAINNGEVTYQCRFLKSNTYLKNHAANRIVVSEFGTKAVPDPCQSIFKRMSAMFEKGTTTDNANVSIYPFGDEFYCFTETPYIHRIDPATLETKEQVNVAEHVAIVNHSAHPHVTSDGSVYNQALSMRRTVPHYSIVKFPYLGDQSKGEGLNQMFEKAEVVASVKARWSLHPSYMHSFGLTDHYYVIVEQPFAISFPRMALSKVFGQAANSCLQFFKDEATLIHVVERTSGQIHRTYQAESFFFFHTINQYEEDDHLVIDICCYSDADMVGCMYFDSFKDMHENPDYARMFKGRPLRFVLPLAPSVADASTNLVTLAESSATAWWQGTEVMVRPELLCSLGCELPRFNYDSHLGKPYRYFYAVSSDVDMENPGSLIKVDTKSKTTKTWGELGVFPSEPIFVPSPNSQREDDGVVLSAAVWGQGKETQVGLVVLDASSWQELGRTVFTTPSAVPRGLHGWFASET